MATALQERGFVVDEVANDSSGREVTGVGELRHGPRGTDAAAYVRLYLPNSGDYLDTRKRALFQCFFRWYEASWQRYHINTKLAFRPR